MSRSKNPSGGAEKRQRREEYGQRALLKSDLSANPTEQLQLWLDEASEVSASEPYAMVLATASRLGRPSSRTLLLKALDDEGLTFYTHYNSRKSRELTENPFASATFLWMELERQVIIEGAVSRLSKEKSSRYFASRPRGAQLGCWASEQDQVIEGREVLDARYAEVERRFGDGDIPLPPSWGGWRIVPSRFEFWQGRQHRLHDRFAYVRHGSEWEIQRLAP